MISCSGSGEAVGATLEATCLCGAWPLVDALVVEIEPNSRLDADAPKFDPLVEPLNSDAPNFEPLIEVEIGDGRAAETELNNPPDAGAPKFVIVLGLRGSPVRWWTTLYFLNDTSFARYRVL